MSEKIADKHIMARLSQIEAEYEIIILYAAECGSRARGMASPTSDYDVRFIYVSKYLDEYLIDTVPRSIDWISEDQVYDFSGWELRKAVKLLAKGNGNLLEWLSSPKVYIHRDYHCIDTTEHTQLSAKALDKIKEISFDRNKVIHCYYGLFSSMKKYIKKSTKEDDPVNRIKLKQYFYIICPLVFLTWYLKVTPSELPITGAIPSTNIPELMQDLQQRGLLASEVIDEINKLIEQKRGMVGRGSDIETIPVIDEWIEATQDETERFCMQEQAQQTTSYCDILQVKVQQLIVEMITHYAMWRASEPNMIRRLPA